MKKLLVLTILISSNAIAEGYYYPVPANPPAYIYALPPAYIIPPQQSFIPPPVYIAPTPPITRGVPPVFVPFETGRVVPRGSFKDED